MSTELHLPPTLPYPIKVVSIDARSSTSIERGTRLLSYSFVYLPKLPDAEPETRFGTWDSPVEGNVSEWTVKPGDVVSQKKAKEKYIVAVDEPCKHGIQIGGLCGLCGKDMTDFDYNGYSDASRASIQMTHSAFGPTVSLEEAQKLEKATADHLLKSRKLSLIVDLDQTIVHATVDPTVGEWIAEGQAWEARHSSNGTSDIPEQLNPSTSISDIDDECNPNWDALKDVKSFRLGPDSFTPPIKSRVKTKVIESEGCMYYIKPRPGWEQFLSDAAEKYEMHVYTMGTRAYAEQVCAAIDPDGKLFAGRILSRDESGSLTQKNLKRLFPCDTSMVVIIDDRADVWEWSPNLIKVIPYDFFVGIGDINSAFLPKLESLGDVIPSDSKLENSIAPKSENSQEEFSPPPENLAKEVEQAELATKEMISQNSIALEAQREERPLAKKQEQLQDDSSQTPVPVELKANAGTNEQVIKDESTQNMRPAKVVRKALLKNDDIELVRVRKLLEEIHVQFYQAYDDHIVQQATNSKQRKPSKALHDVTRIIPRLRIETLDGVHILFSSVIPLDTNPETTEVWKMAHMFGAKCYTELTDEVTHVVAAKRGTMKVDAARKRGGIKIVWLNWFTDSIAYWQHQDERPYLLHDPPPASGGSSPIVDAQISSDLEPDADDWDRMEGVSGSNKLALDDIDWNDINDEVDAAMNESDDEFIDNKSERSQGDRSGNVSEDEANSTSSAPGTPRRRKRLRSATPSELSANGIDQDVLRSPLSKRKKVAADRASRLKEGISAAEVLTYEAVDSPVSEAADESVDEVDDEDDFLAAELEAEMG